MSTSLQYPNVNFTVALHSMHRSKCTTAILCLGVSVLMMHMMTSSSSTTSNHHSNNHPVSLEELCRSNRHIAGKWHKYDNKKTQQSKAFYCCGILDNDYLWNKTLCGDLQALNLEQLYLGTLRYDSGRGRIEEEGQHDIYIKRIAWYRKNSVIDLSWYPSYLSLSSCYPFSRGRGRKDRDRKSVV